MVPSREIFWPAKLNVNLIFKRKITSISYCGTHHSHKISHSDSMHQVNFSFINLTVFHFCSKLISWVYLWRNSPNWSWLDLAEFMRDIFVWHWPSHGPYGLSGEPVVVKLTGNLILYCHLIIYWEIRLETLTCTEYGFVAKHCCKPTIKWMGIVWFLSSHIVNG